MSSSDSKAPGAFSQALVDAEHIRSFMERHVQPLKEQEAELAAPWRSGFRVKLPYFQLLEPKQQAHLRGIFSRMLPDPDVPADDFDREELILLDVLSETYINQAQVFAELMAEHGYRVVNYIPRDVNSRVIALSLSASIFFLDAPDAQRKRAYRYRNIYGNQEIEPTGRCRLKGNLRIARPVRSLEFRSSPVLMMALHPEGVAYRQDFKSESQVLKQTFITRMQQMTFQAHESFSGYTDVRGLDEEGEDEDFDGDENGDPDDDPPLGDGTGSHSR